MANLDDAAAQVVGGTPSNPLDDAANAVVNGTASTVRNNVSLSIGTNPDQEAQYRHLARFVNVPVETVRAQPDAIKQQAALQSMDADKIATGYPHLANYLSDIDNAKLIHDDIPNTAAIEHVVNAHAQAVTPPVATGSHFDTWLSARWNASKDFGKQIIGDVSTMSGVAGLAMAPVPLAYDRVKSYLTGDNSSDASDWWFKHTVDPSFNRADAMAAPANATTEQKAWRAAGGLASTLATIYATGGGSAVAPLYEAGSVGVKGIANVLGHATATAAPVAISGAVDTGRKVYAQTGDINASAKAMEAQYASSSLGMALPLSAAGGVFKRVATGFASGVATSEASRQGMNLAMPNSMQQDFSAEDTIINGVVMSAMGGVMGPRGGHSPAFDAIRKTYNDTVKADTAQQDHTALSEALTAATNSKFRERDIQGFHQYVKDVTEDKPLENLYVDGNAFAQSMTKAGIDMPTLKSELPDVAAQVNEAMQTDGMVKIPLADYAAHFENPKSPLGAAMADFLSDVRTSPDGFTKREADVFEQQSTDKMKEEAVALATKKQTADAFDTSSKAVHADILRNLQATGRYTPEVNKVATKLHQSIYEELARQENITPEEAYAKYGAKITDQGVNGLEQGFEQGADDLIAVHNLDRDKLLQAHALGGLPVPSIGISKSHSPLQGFGDISLIGSKDLIDPKNGTPVFDADAYTSRKPEMLWPKVPIKKADAFIKSLRDYFSAAHDDTLSTHVWDALVNQPDRKGVKDALLRSRGAKLAYLKETEGSAFDMPMKDAGITLGDYVRDPEVKTVWDQVGAKLENMGSRERTETKEYRMLSDTVRDAISRMGKSDRIRSMYAENAFDDNGLITFRTFDRLGSDIVNLGKKIPDTAAADTLLEKAKGKVFDKWVEDKVHPLFDEPKIQVGSKKLPVNLDNIVAAMTKGATRGAEKTLAYGAGQARAGMAKQYKSLEEIQKDRARIVSANDHESAKAAGEKLLENYRDAAAEKYGVTNWKGNIDTWGAMDDSMRVLALLGKKKNPTNSDIIAALKKYEFKVTGADKELIDLTRASLKSMQDTPVDYLEAKPQRAVDFSEFKGAVIPHDTPENVRAVLAEHGIRTAEYSTSEPESRGEATRKLAHELDAELGGILFQSEKETPRGYFNPADKSIALLKNANFSTFVHETGHFMLDTYSRIAAMPDAPPKIKADMGKLLDWFGVDSLEKWNSMSLDEQRAHHEQLAEGMEHFFLEGKAPTLELQPVFSRIRSFMLSVYKSLENFLGKNPDAGKLTDEVRGVFGRMLASEDAIHEAQKVRGYVDNIFKERPEGISDKEWHDLSSDTATQDAIAQLQSRSLRDLRWLSGAKSRAIKDLQKQANEERATIRAEVEKEVAQMPVYRMQDALKEHGIKLTEDNADIIAEDFGYQSGEEAKKALAEAQPRKDVINGLTDRYMLERHGDISSPDALERAAEAAIHNEARARMTATALKVLSKSPISARQLLKGAREAADTAIAAKKVSDLNPKQYEAAESKANKEMLKLAPSDMPGAVRAQRSALLNGQLVKATEKALDDVKRTLDYGKRMEKKAAQNAMRGDFLEQLNALLGRFDMRTSVSKPSADRKPIAKWLEEEADRLSAVAPDLPEWVLNEGYRTHYTELTVDQIRELHDSLKQLEMLARREQKQYMAIRAMDFADERGAILGEIRKHWSNAFDSEGEPKRIEKDFIPSIGKAVSRLGDKAAGEFLSPETLITILGGGKYSVVNESIFGRLTAREDWKATRLEGIYKEMRPLFDQYNLKEKFDFARKDISTTAGLDVALTRENALVVALLHGSPEGRDRLTNYGWGEAKQKQIIDLLDARDFELAKGIWKLSDENLWPELKELNDRTRGKSPPKVQALPYDTRHGTMPGGYYRIKYDSALDDVVHHNEQLEAAKALMGGSFGMTAKTNQGSSIERKDNVTMRPRLDLGVFAESVNETVHDIAYREAVADTMRVLRDKGIASAIKQVVGLEGYRALLLKVDETAVKPHNPTGLLEGFLTIARRNTVINLMSGVKTALQNVTGLAPAFAELKGTNLVGEIARFYSPDIMSRYEFTMQHSEYMRHRFTSYDRDLQRMSKQLTVKGSFMPETSTFLALMGFIDKGVSVPVWNAAFKEGMAKYENDTARAVGYADHVVRQTQGSGRGIDLAQVMSGHPLKKVFTMFYSYFNGQLGLLVKHGVISKLEAKERPAYAAAQFAAKFIAIVAVPAILTEMLMNGPQQDGEDLEHMMTRYAKSVAKYPMGFFPVVRDLAPGIWAQFDSEAHFYGAKVSPLDSMYGSLVQGVASARDVATGENDEKDTKSLIMATGYGLGLPGKLVADTVDGTRAWMNGEAGPESVILGPPKKP